MKLMYITPSRIWRGFYKSIINETILPIEVIDPESGYGKNVKEFINKEIPQIRLWNYEKHGNNYEYHMVMGEALPRYRELELFVDRAEEYKDEILKHVECGDHIIIIQDRVMKNEKLYKFFTKRKQGLNLHIHLVCLVDEEYRDSSHRALIKLVDDIRNIDSIAFINMGDVAGESPFILSVNDRAHQYVEHKYACKIEPWNRSDRDIDLMMSRIKEINAMIDEEIEASGQLIREYAATIVERTTDEIVSDMDSIWIYNHEDNKYELIEITMDDISHTEKERCNNNILTESIFPNDGRLTCQRLKDYRQRYNKNHKTKFSDERKCDYTGECKGVCDYCDWRSEQLWSATNGIRHYGGSGFGAKANVCGISRLRENIDGPGIRSLIVFDTCPLSCEYCINKEYISKFPVVEKITAKELANRLMKDRIYFEATNGGITLGGGEPLLYPGFIHELRGALGDCHMAVETSLNVPTKSVETIVNDIDMWVIDVKSLNLDIYEAYTKTSNNLLIINLHYLLSKVPAEKIICRVPLIPGYNDEKDIKETVKVLKDIGIVNMEEFEYEKIKI